MNQHLHTRNATPQQRHNPNTNWSDMNSAQDKHQAIHNVSSHTSLNATNFYGSTDGQNMNASVRLSPVQTRDVPKKEH